MKIIIKYLDKIQEFENQNTIVIGNNDSCNFFIEELKEETTLKLIYTQKYNNYVLVNSNNDKEILLNNKSFSKVLVPQNFSLSSPTLHDNIEVSIELPKTSSQKSTRATTRTKTAQTLQTTSNNIKEDVFNSPVETNRIAIIKEIGYKLVELKNLIRSANITSVVLHIAMVILSIVSAFGVTNFLLGLKVDNSSAVLNLTTNVGFLICISAIVIAISMILKQGVYALLDFNQTKRLGDSDIAQKLIIFTGIIFMFIIYVINLFYYKTIPGFLAASFFISLLFVGALTAVATAC